MEQAIIKEIHTICETESTAQVNEVALMLEALGLWQHPLYATIDIASHAEAKDRNKCKELFPENVFIPKRVIDMLCEKHQLQYSPLKQFIGDLPLKNLKEIYNFHNKYKRDGWHFKILAPESEFRIPVPGEDPIVTYEQMATPYTTAVVVSKWGLGSNDQSIVNPESN